MIARVFARKTNMSPIDQDAYYGLPQMYMPKYDEVHISVTFTWDIKKGYKLKYQWGTVCDNIKIGGVAFGDFGNQFDVGMYLKKGCVITSRGCNNNCSFCFVQDSLKEIKIKEGNMILDNNFLQCSKKHRSKVYDMLISQKCVEFKGGLQADLLTDWDVDKMRNLKIHELWFACDHKNHIDRLNKAINKCKKYFPEYKLRCYVLIGDDMSENENRLKEVFKIGCYPFAQLLKTKHKKVYSKKWLRFCRIWSRPAIYKSIMGNN